MKQTPPFSALAAHYAETVLAETDLTPGTRVVYRSCLSVLQRHWPGLAGTPVRKIREADCRRWFDRRRKMVGASRLKMELAALRAVFDHAIDEGILTVNPASSVLSDGLEHHHLHVPTRIEFTRLIRRLRFHSLHNARELVELLACSGMTRTEATGLIWADIDADQNTFRVRDSRGDCRTVPLFANMRRLLSKIARRRRLRITPGQPVLRFGDCDDSLRTACRKSSLPRIRYRDLRHFFILEALKQGVPCPMIAAWLGQKDGGLQVARLYATAWGPPEEQTMAERLTYKAGDEAEV